MRQGYKLNKLANHYITGRINDEQYRNEATKLGYLCSDLSPLKTAKKEYNKLSSKEKEVAIQKAEDAGTY